MAKIIAIANQKGGVGKTTTTVNMGIGLASLRSSVGEKINVFQTEIPFSVRAAESTISGKSIYSHDGNGKVAASYAHCLTYTNN